MISSEEMKDRSTLLLDEETLEVEDRVKEQCLSWRRILHSTIVGEYLYTEYWELTGTVYESYRHSEWR